MSNCTPYSYHTFVFPFIWNNNGKVKREKFEKCLHENWVLDERKDDPVDPLLYSQYCYFNQSARNIIFTEKGETSPRVRNYRFDCGKWLNDSSWLESPKGEENPIRYIIEKKIKEEDFKASLRVNGIRLRLFDSGVGMIVYELENYEFNDERSIKRINEYGRRIFAPYLDNEKGCSLCADRITLQYPKDYIGWDFAGTYEGLLRNSEIRYAEIITALLKNGTRCAVTTPKAERNNFYIEPIIDDRMFVICAWVNHEFVLPMKEYSEGEYRYLSDALKYPPDHEDNAARRLYELVFVDGNGVSCYSRTMLHDMLKTHIYDRWLECGTITGMSEYSFFTVSDFPATINAHLMDYTEMAMLVLAQRASLLAFERQLGDCIKDQMDSEQLRQDYVTFQSEYLLSEVSPQQQGIELYIMLLGMMRIQEEKADVDHEIEALYASDDAKQEKKTQGFLNWLTVLGFADIVISCCTFFFEEYNWWVHLLPVAAVIGCIGWGWFLSRKRKKK